MDCQTARLEIPALLQEELDDTVLRSLEDHLRGCPACADEARIHRELLDALRDAATGPDPAVWASIDRAIRSEAPPSRAVPPPPRTLSLRRIAAAAAILIVGGLFLFRPAPGARPSPVAAITVSAGATAAFDGSPVDRPDTILETDRTIRVAGSAGAVLVTPFHERLVVGTGTEMRFTGPRDLSLVRGTLSIESGGAPHLTVTTPAARIVPLGTRYLVVHETETRVYIDEGSVRIASGGREIDVPSGGSARATAGSPPERRDARDVADRLQRHADAAVPSGLRLEARLEPPAGNDAGSPRRRLTVRLLKDPETGLPAVRVSTIAGGLSYLTLTCARDGVDPPDAPAPVIPLDPARLVERGEIRQGVARITPDAPYAVSGEVDLSGILPSDGTSGRLVITWVGRRPPADPGAWAGELASAPISIPGTGGDK